MDERTEDDVLRCDPVLPGYDERPSQSVYGTTPNVAA